MRVVPDRRRDRRSPDEIGVDDLSFQETFGAELLGRRYLAEAAREPRRFLPPPKVRPRRHVMPPPPETESRLSKVAKLAGLTTAGTLLVGAVVASSMVTRTRTEQSGRSTPAPPAITGVAALGGFAMQGSARPNRGTSSPSTRTWTENPAAHGHPSQARSDAPDPGSSDSPTTSSTPAPINDKLAAVNEFYQRMGSERPQDALAMLAPSLAGDQAGDLLRAWSSMSRVEVEDVHVQSDGSVLAVVDMYRRDGSRLRVTQDLELTEKVIQQAVLLSAEQM